MNRRADSQRELVNRYQQEHLQQQQAQVAEDHVAPAPGRSPSGGEANQFWLDGQFQGGAGGGMMPGMPGMSAPAQPANGQAVTAGPGAAGGQGGGIAGPAPQQALPAGLASLDVQIPWRGAVYRFSTPQGDIAITARAASNKLITAASRAAAVLLLVAAVLVVVRLVRQGSFAWLTGRVAGAALLLAGLVLLCLFPVLGIVAILAGLTALARRLTIPQDGSAA